MLRGGPRGRGVSCDGGRLRRVKSSPYFLWVSSSYHVCHCLAEDVQQPLDVQVVSSQQQLIHIFSVLGNKLLVPLAEGV